MAYQGSVWRTLGSVELLGTKPERVLPLSPAEITTLRAMEGLVIGEMAGRDAAAAIMASLSDNDVQVVLPISVYMGGEYGDWRGFEQNADFVREQAKRRGKQVLDTLWMGSPMLWRALNGRYISDLITCFGRYSPCLGCHFYLHAIRIPLAVQLGVKVIIGGDREQHNDRFKINQIPYAIDSYQSLMASHGIELREPLRHITDVAEVDGLLGPDWPGGSPQPSCMFSGNYAPMDGYNAWTSDDVALFLDEFVTPVLDRVVTALISGETINYSDIALEQISRAQRSRHVAS